MAAYLRSPVRTPQIWRGLYREINNNSDETGDIESQAGYQMKRLIVYSKQHGTLSSVSIDSIISEANREKDLFAYFFSDTVWDAVVV